MTLISELLFLLFAGFSVWALTAVQDLRLVRESIRAVLSGENPNSYRTPKLKVSQEIKDLMALFLLSSKKQKSDKGVNERLLDTGHSIAENSERITAVAENGVEIFTQELQPSLVGVFLGITKENSSDLDIVESRNLPLSRIETSILSDVHSNHSNSVTKTSDYGFLGISYLRTAVIDLSNERKLFLWLGFREGLPPEARITEIAQGIIEQLRASMVSAIKARGVVERINQDKDFLLGMSHDLRSPASSALYALYNLRSKQKNIPEIEDIESYLQDQLQIIDNVLDLARHEQHLLVSKPTKISLKILVERVVGKLKWHASQKDLRIRTHNLDGFSVEFDEGHLERIVQNYLNNAVRHTNKGEILISLNKADECYELLVEDSGSGVKSKDRELLFQKFSSLSTLTNTGGFGLGLLICSNLAKINNAQAMYRPSKTDGSIFGLSLCNSTVHTNVHSSDKVSTTSLESILLIEDHIETARALSRQLSIVSNNICHAKDFANAKTILTKSSPSLVVSDFKLGNETVSSLVSRKVPWIIISGDTTQIDLPNNISKEKIRILSKPVEKRRLLSIVRELTSPTQN